MRSLAFVLCGILVAAPAAAEDYSAVMDRLNGLTSIVSVLCPNTAEALLRIADTVKTDTYSLLSMPADPDAKARVIAACASGQAVNLSLSVVADRYGSVDIVPIDVSTTETDPFGPVAISLEAFRQLVNESLKTITEVRGKLDLTSEALMTPSVTISGYEGSGIFFLSEMAPRRAIAYFNECYQLCPEIVFQLENGVELTSYGMSALIYPTDWKLPAPGKNK
jgi:hypothetical protein